MEPHEKQEMVAALAAGRQALVDALDGVTEEAAARSPGPDRWSIRQCVEHVAIAESYLFDQIETATAAEAPMANPRREALIRERGADRNRRLPAPAAGVPTGRFAGVADALRAFLDCRSRTISFVENCAADLRARITTHPIIGTVNCQEMLLMMAAHPERHARQIAEIRQEVEHAA